MDEYSTYVNKSSDLAEKLTAKDSGSICYQSTQFFTSEKLIDLIVIFFFPYKYRFTDMYRTASKKETSGKRKPLILFSYTIAICVYI